MSDRQWKKIDDMTIPAQELVVAQAKAEPILFPAADTITEEWIRLSHVYQYLFGMILVERTGLNRLEERIAQRNIAAASEEQKDYYQKYDGIGLDYFYLRGCARVERLTDEELSVLQNACSAEDDESWSKALEMAERTFRVVMTVNPENPETVYEPLQTLHGDYRVSGNAIPLVLRSVAAFNPDGSLVSEKDEEDRIQVMTSIWKQIDPALTRDLGCATDTAVEVFRV